MNTETTRLIEILSVRTHNFIDYVIRNGHIIIYAGDAPYIAEFLPIIFHPETTALCMFDKNDEETVRNYLFQKSIAFRLIGNAK